MGYVQHVQQINPWSPGGFVYSPENGCEPPYTQQ